MLEMRPDCERIGIDLPAAAPGAHICTSESIFCNDSTKACLVGSCPSCGGELKPRPMRATALLERFSASIERKYKAKA
ncbi:MAG: DUF1272 domain-containing protein [Pseudomonadota bacterium]